jgi:hypothetical protein
MKKLATMFCSVLAFTACTMPPPIASSDGNKHNVEGLREMLNGRHKLVIIFLHGVGDHCPLYALDKTDGWIAEKNERSVNSGSPPGSMRRAMTRNMIE